MSLTVPSPVWEALRGFLEDGRSGQFVLEVREGQIVACSMNQKIRVESNQSINAGMEFKSALVR